MKAPTLVAAALLGGASAHVHRRGHELFHKRSNDTEVCVPGCTTTYTTITGQPTPNAPAKVASTSAVASSATQTHTTSYITSTSTGVNEAGETTVVVDIYTTICPVTAAEASESSVLAAETTAVPAESTATSEVAAVATTPATSVPAASVPVANSVTPAANTAAVASSVPASSVPASSTASTPAVVPTPLAQTITAPGTYTFPATTLTVTETTSVVAATTTEVPSGTYTLGGVTTVVETATTVVCPYATVSTQSGGVVTSVIETTTYVCPAAGTYTIAPTTVTVTAATETVTVPVVSTYLPGTYTAPAVTTVVSTETVVYCPFAASESAAATTSSVVEAAPSGLVDATSSNAAVATSSADALTAGVAVGVSGVIGATASVAVGTAASVSLGVSVGVATPSALTSLIPSASSVYWSSSSSAVSSSTSSAASSTSTSTLGTSTGSLWAMTYTPYDSDSGDCKTADVVDADVASIAAAGFGVLRVYSTDCDTLTNVGAAAAKYSVKIITGIFISEVGCANGSPDVDTQISALKEWGQWDLVELMAVGNEALYDGYCTAQELVDLISHVKSELSDYTGPYTTTDIVAAWQETEVQDLVCDAIDVVSANVHSYFSADTAPLDAGDFVKGQIEIVEQACGGSKKGYVLECGYPTAGATNGLNIPSVANQKIAIASIQAAIGDRVVFFSLFDDQWKEPGTCECEQHWGVGSLFGALGLGDGE
ncbi:hypothetical protein VPNG_03772 [Cytospora leucostoma]|uniref:Probable beta-glucosidase btgE n=1 Tax=Cytospora leucostoma TaxID=1230097 RepID=A0A423XF79_9PEZI|nr:hypothetical protein VPNG_03772 [Cytospora leucostoma]